MSKPIRTTIKAANDRAIAEQRAASLDAGFSLLAHHDELVDVLHGLLGQHAGKGRRKPHPPILRVSTMAPVAHAIRSALQHIVEGPEFTAAVESATQQCLDNVDPGLRPRWRAGARDAALFAARDAIIAGVDRFLVDLASRRPVKANVIAKPIERPATLDHSYRKDYWTAPFRHPMRKPKAHSGGAASEVVCPEPSGFSVADEAYWLLVLVQQMAWPLPDAFNDLYPKTVLGRRFSVDQVRYLIRRDWTWTTLHCARAGVRIDQLDAQEASLVIARYEARDEALKDHPVFGRWPEPDAEAKAAWEDDKRAYFDVLQSAGVLSPADKAFTMALVFAQCGWPMPALVTRLFPADWVTRRLPAHLVEAALSRSPSFNLLDATMAGAALRELTPASIKAFSQRQAERDLRELYGYFDPHGQPEWLRQFFGRQGQGPVSLRDRLEKQMRQALNGADRDHADRITLQAFYQAREIHAPRRPTTTSAPVGSQQIAGEPEVEHPEEDEDAITSAQSSAVEPMSPLADPAQKRPQSPTDAKIPTRADAAILHARLGLELDAAEKAALPPDWKTATLPIERIIRLLPYPRPRRLDTALAAFGHPALQECIGAELALIPILEEQATAQRRLLLQQANEGPPVRRVRPSAIADRWWRAMRFYVDCRTVSVSPDADDVWPEPWEYISAARDDIYSAKGRDGVRELAAIVDIAATLRRQEKAQRDGVLASLSLRGALYQRLVEDAGSSHDFHDFLASLVNAWLSSWRASPVEQLLPGFRDEMGAPSAADM